MKAQVVELVLAPTGRPALTSVAQVVAAATVDLAFQSQSEEQPPITAVAAVVVAPKLQMVQQVLQGLVEVVAAATAASWEQLLLSELQTSVVVAVVAVATEMTHTPQRQEHQVVREPSLFRIPNQLLH